MDQRPDTRHPSVRGPFPYPPDAREVAQAFSDRLTDLRELSGLTVRQLADRSGLPSGTVSALLTARNQPNLRQLLALQRGFGMASVEELLGDPPSLRFGLPLAPRPGPGSPQSGPGEAPG